MFEALRRSLETGGILDDTIKRKLLKSCQLDEPIPPGDSRHYDFDSPVEFRGQPWRQRVAEVIRLASKPTTQIVTGLPGSGKSTELKQLKKDLEERDYRVELADAGAWIQDDEPITHHDILLALVLALYPEGQPEGFPGWATEYAEQVHKLLGSEIEASGFEVGVGSAKVKANLTTDTTLFQQVAKRLGDVQGLRKRVFELLGKAAKQAENSGKPLVIILDGIEKRATGDLAGPEEREKYRNHWFGAFLTHARELRPPVHVVYTVPPFMVRRAPELGAQFGQELQFLPMVRIFQRKDAEDGRPTLQKQGVVAMRDALFKRVGTKYFSDPAVAAWLVVHSGGYIRDLLRLVIDCIYRVDGDVITRDVADQSIVQVRQTYLEGIEAADESLLKLVHQARTFPLDESNKARMDSLLQGYLMLRYHNAIHWYDAHPLLWPRLGIQGPTWDEVAEACP